MAAYWQQWKEGKHPISTYIDPTGIAAQMGAYFGTQPEQATFNGSRSTYQYNADPNTPQWTFSSPGGLPFVCGIVSVQNTAIGAGGSVLSPEPRPHELRNAARPR